MILIGTVVNNPILIAERALQLVRGMLVSTLVTLVLVPLLLGLCFRLFPVDQEKVPDTFFDLAGDSRGECETPARAHEWLGTLGQAEPSPYSTMTMAERFQLVWPITVAAWAFSGKPYDESRLRRDVERLGNRGR